MHRRQFEAMSSPHVEFRLQRHRVDCRQSSVAVAHALSATRRRSLDGFYMTKLNTGLTSLLQVFEPE